MPAHLDAKRVLCFVYRIRIYNNNRDTDAFVKAYQCVWFSFAVLISFINLLSWCTFLSEESKGMESLHVCCGIVGGKGI